MYYAYVPDGDSHEYHVGDEINYEREDELIPYIEHIQADGHELAVIVKMFQDSIPLPRYCGVIRWYGDLARTIHFAMLTSRGFGVLDERH